MQPFFWHCRPLSNSANVKQSDMEFDELLFYPLLCNSINQKCATLCVSLFWPEINII